MKPEFNLHIHIYLSGCCSGSVKQKAEKFLQQAENFGLHSIGFSDHM